MLKAEKKARREGADTVEPEHVEYFQSTARTESGEKALPGWSDTVEPTSYYEPENRCLSLNFPGQPGR